LATTDVPLPEEVVLERRAAERRKAEAEGELAAVEEKAAAALGPQR
jgi:hypothetical protein